MLHVLVGSFQVTEGNDSTCDCPSCSWQSLMQHGVILQVSLKGVVSAVVVTTLVLEGWSTKLDPEIRIMDALKDTLPVSWSERSRRVADKIWRNMSLDPVLHD